MYNKFMSEFNLDPEGKYKNSYIKEYEHWILAVSSHQHTLGCFLIIAKREIERISQLNKEELAELVNVMSDIEVSLTTNNNFAPDLFNYLQLGNGWHHLHFHGIPRYETERYFCGEKWIDKEWGKPTIWNYERISNNLIKEIKEEILKKLPR